MPSNFVVGADTYNFAQWADGLTNPLRTVELISDIVLPKAVFQLQAVTALEIHAFMDSVEVNADGIIVETGETFQTGLTGIVLEVLPGTYTIRLTYQDVTKDYVRTVAEGNTIRVDGQLAQPKPPIPILPILVIGGILLLSMGKKE